MYSDTFSDIGKTIRIEMINCLLSLVKLITKSMKDENKLGIRMKTYEKKWETNLDPTLPFMIRLDGHCFSKFTKQFDKPFDIRSMILSTPFIYFLSKY